MTRPALVLLSLAAATLALGAEERADYWSRAFTGTMGPKLIMEMELERSFDDLWGSYAYARSRDRLLLLGVVDRDGLMTLTEQTSSGEETGRFEGRLDEAGNFTGTWSDPARKRRFEFMLKPTAARPRSTTHAWARDWQWIRQGERDEEGTIVIASVGGDWIRARGSKTVVVGSPGEEPNAHTGEFHGLARVREGAARLKSGECEVTLSLTGEGLQARDNDGCGGMGVSFTGSYR